MTQKSNLLSDKKLEQIAAGKMWDFHGGVHPEQNKLQSNQSPITDAGIPEELIIAVEQKGHIPQLLVEVGDTVLKGQPLTKVYGALVVQHASSSGVVKAIEPRTDCHPSGLPVLSIVIETDGLDRPFPSQGFNDYRQEMPATLIEATQQAGIVGLGGAGFATHLKLAHNENRLLIINAIECEPYITADDRLIQEHADEIIEGINILQHILQPKLTIFAVEDNKPEAIEAFTKSLQSMPGATDNILLRVIPTRYPSGSAKQLIEVLTGEQTPIHKHSSELGISMFNVGTAFAVKEAIINGKPLVSRIVTITGDAFARKGNASVRIGTPIQHLLDTYWLNALHHQQLIIGGPMMGFTVSDPSMPVSKTCNCILAPTEKELPQPEPEMNCIRCSECAEACPVELLPQQLLWYSQSEDHKKLEEYDLSACIECGACAFVCPSHIPLVEYYRVSKSQIKAAKYEAEKAAIARKRHEDRELRLETEKQQRQLKHKLAAEKRKQQMKDKNGGEDLVAAALARAKAKKQANSEGPAETSNKPTAANSQVAAAIARAKAKKQAAESSTQSEDVDPKKATVAAAIARAKAKKQAAAEAKAQSDSSENNIEVDPKKAAVAAAIARAKAKKQAAAESTTDTETDPKKAAVAAAIARAKAKKQAAAEAKAQPETSDTSEDNVETDADPKKAAIAAAVARAKAKKQAAAEAKEQPEISDTSEDNVEIDADPKKAAIAAAVARAKAKKQAAAEAKAQPEKSDTSEDNVEIDADPKKAAIAAAVARAKAKKQAAAEAKAQPEKSDTSEDNVETDVDPKKAAIAAAVARAKAKKQAAAEAKEQPEKSDTSEDNVETDADPKKAAIAAAVARAKAKKKAAEEAKTLPVEPQAESVSAEPVEDNPVDDKKARIAAAIAKAKAKKQAEKDQ